MSKSRSTVIAKNTLFLSFRMIFALLVSLYTSRVTLQVLGVVDFGIYNVVAGFVTMFAFLKSALTNGIQRFFNFEIGKNGAKGANQVFVTSLVIQGILAILILIVTESVGLWYIKNKMVIMPDRLDAALWVFQAAVISLLFIIIQVPYSAAVVAHEKMDFYAIVGVADTVLKLVIVLVLSHLPFDKLITYSILLLLISFLNLMVTIVYSRKKFPEVRVQRSFNKVMFKGMLSFSGWNVFGTFATTMRGQGVNMILNLFFGPVVNAARGIAYQVSNAIHGFISNITVAVRPQLIQSYAKGEEQRSIQLMVSSSKACFFVFYILSVPVMLEINYILHIWLGEKIPDETPLFVILVLSSYFIRVLDPSRAHLVHATGNIRKYQIANSIVSLIQIPVTWLILKIGCPAYSSFIILIMFSGISATIDIIILSRLVNCSVCDYLMQIIKPIFIVGVLSAIIPFFAHYLLSEGLFRLSVVTVANLVSCLLFTYYLGLSKGEKELIVYHFNNRIIKRLYRK